MDKITELKADVAEIEHLLSEATRQKVKDILTIEIRKLVTELVKLEEEHKKASTSTTPTTPVLPNASKCYLVKLNNYAWDQTLKFIKFYVTLKNVQTLPEENIFCTFTNKSMEMNVKGLDNKDYILTIKNLLMNVNPEASTWKIKNDMVIINVAKIESINWSHVTDLEKKAADAKKIVPNVDKEADPSNGLMSIMKSMYDSGDDEMKRTIAKAWTESQDKSRGDGGMMGGMGAPF